jgi:4-hydroxyphenylpyruvate dioxygenase
LVVDDAAKAYARALALDAEPFSFSLCGGRAGVACHSRRRRRGRLSHRRQERSGRFSEIDFRPVAQQSYAASAGLLRVDHIAQTVAYDEMLTWLLFYTSIFETSKTPMVDIIDPAGVVRSQVVENETGQLRITMNGAENRRTLAGHFIAEKFGSGIQHLAFATDDIVATAAEFAGLRFQIRCTSRRTTTTTSRRALASILT